MPACRLVMQIDGAKELQAKLDTLTRTEEKGVFRDALRDAQKLMQSLAKADARTFVGGVMGKAISDNIILRAFKKRRKYSVGNNVMSNPAWVEEHTNDSFFGTGGGHSTGAVYITKSTGLRQYIPAAIEYGHVVRTGRTGGLSKGARKLIRKLKNVGLPTGQRWVAPIPYMRTASKMSETGRFRILAERISKYIERTWLRNDLKSAANTLYEDQIGMLSERSTGDEF
jgi:hypothetical protein